MYVSLPTLVKTAVSITNNLSKAAITFSLLIQLIIL